MTTGNSHGASTDNKTKTDTNRMEVTAKGFKKAKDAKKLEKKKEVSNSIILLFLQSILEEGPK